MSASGCWSGTVTSGPKPSAMRSQSWTDEILILRGHMIGHNRRPRRRREPDRLNCPLKNSSHPSIFDKHPLISSVGPLICCVPPESFQKGRAQNWAQSTAHGRQNCKKSLILLVGGAGFEPATPGL